MVLLAITCSKPQQAETEFGIDLKRDQQPLAELGPAQDRLCAECHPAEVADFKSHGMADSIAVLDAERIPAQLSSEFIASPNSDIKYNVGASGSWHVNAVHEASSTSLSIPISHRIGAGVADMSFVINQNGRWFFSPLEFFTHRGWHPAPHEVHSSGGLNSVPITAQCLQCHTSSPIPDVYPYNNFGDYQPQPISCATCHGDGDAHVNLMRENKFASDVKILNPRDLSPERQLDICARCHLEGDAHIDLRGRHNQQLAAGENLLDAHAVLVANESAETELRFVSQVQRLSQSECFQQSPQMTCTTCHDPHQAARFQHSADFDAKCQACHSDFKELHRDQTDTANCA
ncbi:MAG: hypothetical protein QGF46_04810, partial [Planctomycetota bacterium]|nr:hypothetical protein [Planctomycetota bacterium]